MPELDAFSCEDHYTSDTDQYSTEHGFGLTVQARDRDGNNVMDEEDSSMKWLPCQPVHDVIIAVADNIPRSPWEWIRVYQGHAAIEENMPLGFLADDDGTVHLIVERVTEIYAPKARAALSQADICANAGQWGEWHR